MQYLYFKSERGNFGDDINPWLWPKLFKDLNPADTYFLGIGSILHQGNKSLSTIKNSEKIVFGTGLRPSKNYKRFAIDEKWDIRFLRGPLSSFSFNNNFKYITDAAYAIRQSGDFDKFFRQEKKYKVSLMPYFHSVEHFDWQSICNSLGYHYISPYSENGVEFTIKEIAASECLISEAMHGAILADILRVPWHRFILTTPYTEGERISEFKWSDWLYSIEKFDHEPTYIPFYRKSQVNLLVRKATFNIVNVEFLIKNRVVDEIISKLSCITEFDLSQDQVINRIDEKLGFEVSSLIKCYK